MSSRIIIVAGITYVRSRDAARTTGISIDYVSRLARGGRWSASERTLVRRSRIAPTLPRRSSAPERTLGVPAWPNFAAKNSAAPAIRRPSRNLSPSPRVQRSLQGAYRDYGTRLPLPFLTAPTISSATCKRARASCRRARRRDLKCLGCTVAGTNGDTWSGTPSGNPGKTSGAVNQQSVYTLSCTALDSSTYQELNDRQLRPRATPT